MSYRRTGVDRDSYICGRNHAPQTNGHDVNARKDNLPANVFQYLKEQVAREHYESYIYQHQRANNQLSVGKAGRRILLGGESAEQAEEHQLAAVEHRAVRHQQLKQLYAAEAAAWDVELRRKGLALDRSD